MSLHPFKVTKHFFLIVYMASSSSEMVHSRIYSHLKEPTLLWLVRWSLLWLVYYLQWLIYLKCPLPYLIFQLSKASSALKNSHMKGNDGVSSILSILRLRTSQLKTHAKRFCFWGTQNSVFNVDNTNQTLPCLNKNYSVWESSNSPKLFSLQLNFNFSIVRPVYTPTTCHVFVCN